MMKDTGKIGILGLLFFVFVFPACKKGITPEDAIKKAQYRGLTLYAIISTTYYDPEEKVLKYRYAPYRYKFMKKDKDDVSKNFFDKKIFNSWTFFKDEEPRDFNLWLHDIDKYESFSNTADIVLRQLLDLAGRLDSLYKSKEILKKKYGNNISSDKIAILDRDICYLSELGNRLIEATRSFFDSARETMINLDIAEARQKALDGLKSFNQDIERIKVMQLKSVDQSINMVVEAMKNLEKATNR